MLRSKWCSLPQGRAIVDRVPPWLSLVKLWRTHPHQRSQAITNHWYMPLSASSTVLVVYYFPWMGGPKCQESCHIPMFQVEQRVNGGLNQAGCSPCPPSRNCDLNRETIFCTTCFKDKPELNNGWKTEGGSPNSHKLCNKRVYPYTCRVQTQDCLFEDNNLPS